MTILFLLAAAATQVIRYSPPATLPAESRSGHCWTSSIAAPYRADAWRCFVGNEIHDPCFATAQPGRVICDMNPAAGAPGFQLKLTQSLPEADKPPAANSNWAWLIELADGTTCAPFTGTNPLVQGEVAHYGCTAKARHEDIVLLGDLVVHGSAWTAKRAVLAKGPKGPVIQSAGTVRLKTVWQ